ncbi:glycoside hydrolase family 16 protein [Streptomyces sp. NPDC049597]|uniref:glycoside hydrolase family 16 protein n=1 Tax=Streptomyces sp. NPDC049597 TaxID=3155276 RepID=UPI003419F2CB
MDDDYEVFVHFVDADGEHQSALNADHSPPQPTSAWSGAVSYDHTISVPPGTPAGQYSVRVGLYQNHSPWDRVPLAQGEGVTVDDQLRYTVGRFTVSTDSSCEDSGPAGQDPGNFSPTFSEEFNSGLDTSVWNDHIWYESSNPTTNYKVEGGALKIWPQRDASGRFFNRTIDTDGKYYQRYGFFEMEAKLPIGKGAWPAFWLFNHIDDRRPEIDVMEAYPGGGPDSGWSDSNLHPTAFAATVWPHGASNDAAGHRTLQTADLSQGFHKYGVKWEPNKLTFYFDGQEFYSLDVAMSDPMYIILDLWFGSASGDPDDSTPTGESNAFEVNYVRAWQFR